MGRKGNRVDFKPLRIRLRRIHLSFQARLLAPSVTLRVPPSPIRGNVCIADKRVPVSGGKDVKIAKTILTEGFTIGALLPTS